MSKGWSITLFILSFFLIFALFQLDSETRNRNRRVRERLEELDLKVATYIRGAEAENPKGEITKMQDSHRTLLEDFRNNRKTIIELLELLIVKNEEQNQAIDQLKKELDALKKSETPEAKEPKEEEKVAEEQVPLDAPPYPPKRESGEVTTEGEGAP